MEACTRCVLRSGARACRLDPIFSGVAWAIIFGIMTSTAFALLVIPVVYWLLYGTHDAQIAELASDET